MFDAGRRPSGRFFYWLLAVVTVFAVGLSAFGAPGSDNGPATTTVADTVYLADGATAQGNLIITWPAFVTASGTAVASGSNFLRLYDQSSPPLYSRYAAALHVDDPLGSSA